MEFFSEHKGMIAAAVVMVIFLIWLPRRYELGDSWEHIQDGHGVKVQAEITSTVRRSIKKDGYERNVRYNLYVTYSFGGKKYRDVLYGFSATDDRGDTVMLVLDPERPWLMFEDGKDGSPWGLFVIVQVTAALTGAYAISRASAELCYRRLRKSWPQLYAGGLPDAELVRQDLGREAALRRRYAALCLAGVALLTTLFFNWRGTPVWVAASVIALMAAGLVLPLRRDWVCAQYEPVLMRTQLSHFTYDYDAYSDESAHSEVTPVWQMTGCAAWRPEKMRFVTLTDKVVSDIPRGSWIIVAVGGEKRKILRVFGEDEFPDGRTLPEMPAEDGQAE